MSSNPLTQLTALGQSIWLDYIKRDLMSSGQLKDLIEQDSLMGITSNPSIFEEAISKSADYDDDIQKMKKEGQEKDFIYDNLTQKDVATAADEFRAVYDKTQGKDGFVSLEVNPHLAHDTKGTIEEARRLWQALNRPNVLIKVPATAQGIPAIKQLISEGVNVNVTLLFGLGRYCQVVEAYLSGLEMRAETGKPINQIASVASFFLSRIDSLIDPKLEKLMDLKNENGQMAQEIHGQVAIASAKMAYQIFKDKYQSARFKKLAGRGAQVQRLLWASTSTKNPQYSDVKYVEALIGPQTVNTLPMETLNKYRDHGAPKALLERDLQATQAVFDNLKALDMNIDTLTQQLEDEGVEKFNQSFDQLIAAIKSKMR